MPKTRVEFLAEAERWVGQAVANTGPQEAQTMATIAIACILLAQERRIDEERITRPKGVEKP